MSRRLFSIQIESDGPVTASVDSVATDGPSVSSETYPRLEARSVWSVQRFHAASTTRLRGRSRLLRG
jgi:hypothetical protein